MNKLLKFLDKIFLSVPLTIVFILLLCFFCLFAVVFPFKGIFASGWFLVYLSYVVFMMVYCSLRRLPGIIRQHYGEEREKFLFKLENIAGLKQSVFSSFFNAEDKENVAKTIDQVLCKKGYKRKVNRQKEGGDEFILYEKAKYSIFGPHFVHLAICILLIAGIITAWGGNFYDQDIREGETFRLPGTETRLTLEKFSVLPRIEKNIADEYASRLRINRKGFPVEWYTLKVNNPLRIDGYRLYQNKFRYDIEKLNIAVYDPSRSIPVGLVLAKMNERVVNEELDIAVEAKDFLPDFAINEEGKPYNRTHFFTNPACFISVFSPADSQDPVYEGWAFRNFLPHGEKKGDFKRSFRIVRLKVRNVSGLKFAKNPGEFITYAGLIILVIGSFISCYKFYRCLIVRIERTSEKGKMNFHLSALKAKNMFEFERELEGIKDLLNKSLGGEA